MNKKQLKTLGLSIRITPTMKNKFIIICTKEHRSQSDQIAYWISQYEQAETSDEIKRYEEATQ